MRSLAETPGMQAPSRLLAIEAGLPHEYLGLLTMLLLS